jgi:glycosyltransferase involved in cell wall biosynthesis
MVLDRHVEEHPLASDLGGSGVQVHPIELGGRAYLAERAAVDRLCREVRPDVVHTHGYRPDVVDGSVPRQRGIPVVATLHGFTGGGWRNRFYEKLQRLAYRRFDAVVVVSRAQARQLEAERVAPDRLHWIPNVLPPSEAPMAREDARRILRLTGPRRCVGWVGRLSWEKAPDVFLRAMACLNRRDVHASLVGDGPGLRATQHLVSQLGLDASVTLHGIVARVGRLLAAFDVFALSSRIEGVPIVLFEAVAAGVPIVATRVGGVPDVFSENSAWLVPPDDPPTLAHALHEALEDRGAAAAHARAARERIARDTYAEWLSRYERVYDTVVAGRGTRPSVPPPT